MTYKQRRSWLNLMRQFNNRGSSSSTSSSLDISLYFGCKWINNIVYCDEIKKLRFFVNIKLLFCLRFQWKWLMKLTTNKLTWRDVSHCSDLKVRICGKRQVFVFSSISAFYISHFQITKHHLLCVNTHPPSSWAKQHKTPSLCSIGEHKKSLKSYKSWFDKKKITQKLH